MPKWCNKQMGMFMNKLETQFLSALKDGDSLRGFVEDGCVVTVSPDGTARQIECFKCHRCGYSVSKGQ